LLDWQSATTGSSSDRNKFDAALNVLRQSSRTVLAAPLLMLGLAAAVLWFDPANIQTALGIRLLHVWQGLAPGAQPSQPPVALPLEVLALLLGLARRHGA